jgi:transposase InsO family protein
LLCSTLKVRRSCYYAWKAGQSYLPKPGEKDMEDQVISVFRENRRRYGVRRIVKELGHRGQSLSNYKVRQHLRRNGLRAIQPRSFVPKTTNSRHTYRISPNLLKDRAVPDAPNQVWVGDITYIPMTEGRFLYLSVWMDLCSRKIVGWDLQDHMRESLILASLRKALGIRKIRRGLIVHSDRGGQYAGGYFRRELAKYKILQSMSDADNPYDNAHMESFFSRFKAEMLEGGAFRTAEDARSEIFEYIELYYNARRLHSSIGYLSPNNFETV